MRVPVFLLRRLYVRGSLRATGGGFEFKLLNRLGSGYARRLLPLTLDGTELDMAKTTFAIGRKRVSFDAVNNDTPFTLALDRTTTIAFAGGVIAQGLHRIGLGFEVAGLGEMAFEFSDVALAG